MRLALLYAISIYLTTEKIALCEATMTTFLPGYSSADLRQQAWFYAARKHQAQTYPGTGLPYLTHLGSVLLELTQALIAAPEIDANLAMLCAILHDSLEDTEATAGELAELFGESVAAGVGALSKNKSLRGEAATRESLERIQKQPREIWLVKLADRAANLGTPPEHWAREKRHAYAAEGELILNALGEASAVLAKRLAERIAVWKNL
jgi:(p)ppGpp synthase/HD superfamily hydrolase